MPNCMINESQILSMILKVIKFALCLLTLPILLITLKMPRIS